MKNATELEKNPYCIKQKIHESKENGYIFFYNFKILSFKISNNHQTRYTEVNKYI